MITAYLIRAFFIGILWMDMTNRICENQNNINQLFLDYFNYEIEKKKSEISDELFQLKQNILLDFNIDSADEVSSIVNLKNKRMFTLNRKVTVDSVIKKYNLTTKNAWKFKDKFYECIKGINNCQEFFVQATCENGHSFKMPILCHREYCTTCGSVDSHSHIRKKMNAAKRLIGYDYLGYFVFTIPEDVRHKFKNKSSWKNFVRKVKEQLLKKFGMDCGLWRYHWFGDKDYDLQKKFCDDLNENNNTINGNKIPFNPHLNVIIPRDKNNKWIDSEILDFMKDELTNYFHSKGSKVEKAVLHYSYVEEIEKKWHLIRYVTRPTFKPELLEFHPDLAIEIYNFRNCNPFGNKYLEKFDLDEYLMISEKFDEENSTKEEVLKHNRRKAYELVMSKIMDKVCPCCGGSIVWERNIIKLTDLCDLRWKKGEAYVKKRPGVEFVFWDDKTVGT
jgi:hypothetical protein